MTRDLKLFTTLVLTTFCFCVNSCKEQVSQAEPDFGSVKNWTASFVGKRKDFIYDYFPKKNVNSSTWEYEGENELLLTSQYQEMEVSFFFLDDVVLLASVDYSTD